MAKNAFLSRVRRGLKRRVRSLKRTADGIWQSEFCGAYINWRLPPNRWDASARMHWCYTQMIWKYGKIETLVTTLIWPILSFVFAWKQTKSCGSGVKARTGVPLLRQFAEQVYLANVYHISPKIYYHCEFYLREKRRQARHYIQDDETVPLLELANGAIDYSVFDDKTRFYEICKQFAVATIPVVARFENGEMFFLESRQLPKKDLFAKPERGKCGQGALVYTYVGAGRYRIGDGRVLSGPDVLGQIAGYSQHTPYILQEKYENHPAIARVYPDALCTCRIVTCKTPAGGAEIVSVVLRMPTGGQCTDNVATGGIAIPVDHKTGTLGKGLTKDMLVPRMNRHPDTGKVFTGLQIPCWQDVIALCLKANEVFGAYPLIGWDVAVAGDGPILVEGNLRFNIEAMQFAHSSPFGDGGFAPLYLAYIRNGRRLN
jgi:Sugar-transfer associated ATP-grasp